MNATKKAVSPPSTASKSVLHPHLFYAAHSAHLSQSDFGVLFPWVTRLVFKAQDLERILRLNTRAITEVMRRAGIEVARTTEKEKKKESIRQILRSDDRIGCLLVPLSKQIAKVSYSRWAGPG